MIGLYIHVPFCRKKCAYCDFYSVCDLDKRQAYVDALCREMDAYRGQYDVDTIFVGGGTPSLLSTDMWRQIAYAICRNFNLAEGYEFTVECNPDSLTADLAATLKEIGVNRMSIGVQSLDGFVLMEAGRIHDAAQAKAALNIAKQYFDNVNADLIIGLPYQTLEGVLKDVETLAPLVTHMSVYALQLEEGTPLYDAVEQGDVTLPDEDTMIDMYDDTYRYLTDHGYHRYEVSNYATEGKECRHNLNCWRFHDYIGIGAAAHGYLSGVRYRHDSDVDAYLSDPIRREVEEDPDQANRKFEMIMLGLRTEEGLDIAEYDRLFDADFRTEFADILRQPLLRGATRITEDHFAIRPAYLNISNTITIKFMDQLLGN